MPLMTCLLGRCLASCLAFAAAVAAQAQPSPPSQQYPQLFDAVQMARVFPDSKTFADAVPRSKPEEIEQAYLAERGTAGFSLPAFVRTHFSLASPIVSPAPAASAASGTPPPVAQHIAQLWSVLSRPPISAQQAQGSLLPLPAPYVVPGGRFRELYYWDSYFTMLGLIHDGRRDLARGMVTDFADEIDRYGHVPNGNRTYYLSRSQPPFFYMMVALLATPSRPGALTRDDIAQAYATYLPQLSREHAYWMDGADTLAPGQAFRHAVALPDGAVLNRYWDDRGTPRDESYREDVDVAARSGRPPADVFRDLRAGAESGWDYSSRWLADGHHLETIQTTSLLPVDLNALLYGLEVAISEACRWRHDGACVRQFNALAARRHAALDRYLWDAHQGFYVDYQWRDGKPQWALTAATAVPLFVGLASREQAFSVASVLMRDLLRDHGLATTLVDSAQQWDEPNGWAPLQWMAVQGCRRYGHTRVAEAITRRWISTVTTVYQRTGKLMEKYDVVSLKAGGGGEYPGQDGFGWTNGVLAAMLGMAPMPRPSAPRPSRAGAAARPEQLVPAAP